MPQPIEGRARELLEAPNFCFLATLRRDGTPHLVPIWVDLENGSVVVNTAEGRTWPRNARRDPRVTLTVADHENPYEFVSIRGHVVEDTHEGADEHIDHLAKKYLGVDTYPYRAPGEVRIKFRIEPDQVIHHGRRSGSSRRR
jgi:PPOX class probable F420-dependent enzyme